jgi:autotransporter family porin
MTNHCRRTLLSASILMTLLPSLAEAGDLNNGAVATWEAGQQAQTWRLRNGSTLNLNDGAVSKEIQVETGSFLNVTGATITDSGSLGLPHAAVDTSSSTLVMDRATITSSTRWGVALGYLIGNPVTPTATIVNSTISAQERGISLTAMGTVTLANTSVISQGGGTNSGGVMTFGGSFRITDRSVVQGQDYGVRLIATPDGLGTDVTEILIDGSTVTGSAQHAIYVSTNNKTTNSAVNIVARNGATLVGGNGNILFVEKRAPTLSPVPVTFLVESSTLSGNVVAAADGSILDVTLANDGRIHGMFDNVSSVALNDGGYWQLTADSSVGRLALATGGTLELGDGNAFHALTADSFTGSGGTVAFNTVLGDDTSATDRLHVLGDTSGQAFVSVKNAGGAGAQTVEGIQLIQVDGASNGQFQLAGRAVGGLYEYFLYKGGVSTPTDGGWYLRSELPAAPDPCDTNPTAPGCPGAPVDPVDPVTPVDPVDPVVPIPVLRPEPGAYLANLRAAQMMFRTDYHSRQDGQNHGRAWARVDGRRTSFDAVDSQLDIHGNSQALNVGADLLRNDAGSSAGVMLSSGNATSTSTSTLTGYWARGKVKGNAVGVYGTWRGLGNDDGSGFYVDGWAQYQQFRNRVEGIGLATERYDSKAWQGAVETGYAFRLGSAVLLEPQVQVGYTDLTMDDHTEANGTIVRSDRDGGLFGRAGLRLSGAHPIGTSGASVQPYLQANWVYNRNSEAISFDGEIADTRIPKSRVQVGGGASLRFAGGFGAWGGLSVESASGYRATSAQVGMSYRW